MSRRRSMARGFWRGTLNSRIVTSRTNVRTVMKRNNRCDLLLLLQRVWERERESSRKCKTWDGADRMGDTPPFFRFQFLPVIRMRTSKNNTSAKCNLSLSQKISFLCCYVIWIETGKRSNCFDQVLFLRETKWFQGFQFRIEDTAIEIIVQTWSGTHVRDNPELDRCRQMPDPVRLVRFGR